MSGRLARRLALSLISLPIASGLPASASAAEFEAAIGKTGFGRCHMLTCGFFIIDDASPIGTGKDGTLFAVSARYWSSEYRDTSRGDPYSAPPIKTSKPDKSSLTFIYCSKTRPTIFTYEENKWQSTLLRIGSETAVSGVTESARTFYLAACHRFITRDPVAKNMPVKLGYKFATTEKGDAIDGDGEPEPLAMLK